MDWCKDGEKLASGAADGSIKIWFMDRIASALTGSTSSSRISGNVSVDLSTSSSQHSRSVNQLQWCPWNFNALASCSHDKTVKIWDVSGLDCLNICTEIENLSLCWHPSRPILTVGTKDDRILFYEFNEKDNFRTTPPVLIKTLQLQESSCEINDISWSADGKHLAVALGSSNCEIFGLTEDFEIERVKSLKAHTADCFTVRHSKSSSSNLLALGSSDAQITLWRNYNCFRVLNRMEWPIRTCDFSYDGEFLAVGSEDPFIAIEHVNSNSSASNNSLVAKIYTTNTKNSGVPVNSVTWHPSKHILAFATSEVDDRTGKAIGSIKLFGL